MPRPQVIDDDALIDAAREVFLARGPAATTAEVARVAGISEGSIFRRYKTKEALFRAAMKTQAPDWLETLDDDRARGDDLVAHLARVGEAAIEFFRVVLPISMMAWATPGPDGLPAIFSGSRPAPLIVLDRVRRFFAARIRAGELRGDPAIVARIFVGSLENYVFFEIVGKGKGEKSPSAADFARGVATLICNAAGTRQRRR